MQLHPVIDERALEFREAGTARGARYTRSPRSRTHRGITTRWRGGSRLHLALLRLLTVPVGRSDRRFSPYRNSRSWQMPQLTYERIKGKRAKTPLYRSVVKFRDR